MVILFLFNACLSLFAYPQKGDFVRYEAQYKDDVVIMTKKVIEYYPDRSAYLVGHRVTFKDRILEEVAYDTPGSFLYTPEKVQDVLKNCVAREGAITHMVIQNEAMDVCEFWDEGSQLTSMIGPVPFGQVRFQVYMGQGEEFLDFQLKEFIK